MASILDTIQDALFSAFLDDQDSFFRPAEVVRTVSTASAYKAGSATTTRQPCRALVSSYSAMMRAQAGIPGEEMRISVLQRNDAGEWVEVRVGDTIIARGQEWRVIDLTQDAARATWTARCKPNG